MKKIRNEHDIYRYLKLQQKNIYNGKIAKHKKKKFVKSVVVAGAFTVFFVGISMANGIGLSIDDVNIKNDVGISTSQILDNYDNNHDNITTSSIEKYSNNKVLYEDESVNRNVFNVSSSDYVYLVENFLQSEIGSYVYKYCDMYGLPPEIIASICMQETTLDHYSYILGGDLYSGYGVGLMQIEQPSGECVSCYNYNTSSWDQDYITMENACDIEKNIKLGCMLFQNRLYDNGGNILLAIQSYNYGQGMMDSILSSDYGNKISNVKADYENIDWLDSVKEAHFNPRLYISDWEESEYGDGDYLCHVLRFCPKKEISYKYNYQQYTYDLSSLKITGMYEYNTIIKY